MTDKPEVKRYYADCNRLCAFERDECDIAVIRLTDHEAAIAEEAEATDQWRKLAHQFDAHRMQAMWCIKEVSKGQAGYRDCEAFLSSAPECGDSVIAAHDASRTADKARISTLTKALEKAATAMWNSETNMDNDAADIESALAALPKEGVS